MIVNNSRNVNYALWRGVKLLKAQGERRESRAGPVIVAPAPVMTVYEQPRERVLFHPVRDANPFFHLIEAMWMFAGRSDVAPLTQFVARMRDYSDDGAELAGAYGWRWRGHFGWDQLEWAIKRLIANPDDRRVVIQMYDPFIDKPNTDEGGRDIPCNLSLLPQINPRGELDLTVVCRSNDMLWGAYGANAVHFSFLQEYLAAHIGVPAGVLYQFSTNFHAYTKYFNEELGRWPHKLFSGRGRTQALDPYAEGLVMPRCLIGEGSELASFDDDVKWFMDEPTAVGIRVAFLRRVAAPMWMAHKAYKKETGPERFKAAREVIQQVEATDWRLAAEQWIDRREADYMGRTEG